MLSLDRCNIYCFLIPWRILQFILPHRQVTRRVAFSPVSSLCAVQTCVALSVELNSLQAAHAAFHYLFGASIRDAQVLRIVGPGEPGGLGIRVPARSLTEPDVLLESSCLPFIVTAQSLATAACDRYRPCQ